MSKITDIRINPYKSPPDSLSICCMIAEETQCNLNSGEAGGPLYLQSESIAQFEAVMALCNVFGLSVIYPTTQHEIAVIHRILGR